MSEYRTEEVLGLSLQMAVEEMFVVEDWMCKEIDEEVAASTKLELEENLSQMREQQIHRLRSKIAWSLCSGEVGEILKVSGLADVSAANRYERNMARNALRDGKIGAGNQWKQWNQYNRRGYML